MSAPDPATVKAEREAATKVYVACLYRAAHRLDDHKSDPTTIARGLLSACGAEFDAQVDVYSRYLENGLQGREIVARKARENSLNEATQIVLESRKAGQRR